MNIGLAAGDIGREGGGVRTAASSAPGARTAAPCSAPRAGGGWQAPGTAREQAAHRFWINNVRANIFWRNQFLDQKNAFVQDRYPHPFVETRPDDRVELGLNPGDLLEIVNDNGVTQGRACPMAALKRNTVARVFGSPAGRQGNLVNPGVNELAPPGCKHCWGDIRKIANATARTARVSCKSHEVVL